MNSNFFLLIVFFFIACSKKGTVYNHTVQEVDLGNNFYYLADGRESQILLNLKPEAKSKFGKTVIPPEIVSYNYDSKYIIAQTNKNDNGSVSRKYWIIKKEQKSVDTMIPLDSATFYNRIDSLKLKIKLNPR